MSNVSVPTSKDHAGVWVPPPLLYVVIFLAGMLLQQLLPLPRFSEGLGLVGGIVFLAAWAVLIVWSVGLFRRAHTSLLPVRPAQALVVQGPYRFTRNPMYLSLLCAYVGVALLTRLIWPVLLLPLVILAVNTLVIRKEEQYLERKFGSAYTAYKEHVRRWI